MSSATHTDKSKTGRHRTIVVVIGVLVALVIGLSLSASAFNGVTLIPVESTDNSFSAIISALKMGSSTVKGALYF